MFASSVYLILYTSHLTHLSNKELKKQLVATRDVTNARQEVSLKEVVSQQLLVEAV
jgi:hypothetical protein